MAESTKLLLRFDGNFTDKSGNVASANIVNTNVTVNSSSMKFGSGSGSFNGTNSFISIQSQYLPAVSGDWTVDWWEYRTSVVVNSCILNATADGASNNDRGILIGYAANSSNLSFYATDDESGWNIASGLSMGTVQLNQWVHRAVVKSGNNYYTFQNGVLQAQTSSTRVPLTPGVTNIGSYAGGLKFYNGLIDEFRISDIARWTSNFNVPTEDDYIVSAPLYIKRQGIWAPVKKVYRKNNSSWAEIDSNDVPNYITSSSTLKPKYLWKKKQKITDNNLVLSINFDKSINDESDNHIPLINQKVTISGQQPHFNTNTGYFDGDSYILFDNSYVDFKDSDFTIEWWEFVNNSNSKSRFCTVFGDSTYGGLLLGFSGNLVYMSSLKNSWNMISSGKGMSNTLNEWVYWAIVRNNNTFTTYRNGTKFYSINISGSIYKDQNINKAVIGDYRPGDRAPFIGYIDDFRIYSTAKYTSNFTIPEKPFSIYEVVGYIEDYDINKYPSNGLAADGYYYERV